MNGKNVDKMPEIILYILAKLEMEKISIWKWETNLPFDMEIHLPFGKVYLLIALKTLSDGSYSWDPTSKSLSISNGNFFHICK